MAKNMVFEIGTEEIPAKFMPDILVQIKEIAKNKFAENRLEYKNIKSVGTPRRITLIAEGLAEKQSDLDEMVKGPAKKAAYDENGQLTKAALGFLKSKGANEKDIVINKLGEVEYVYVKKHEAGKESKEVLKTILPEIIYSINFPKSMRWRDYDIRFARPIRWIVTVLDNQVIDFSIGGAVSSNKTRGHRTLANNDIEIKSADAYADTLMKAFVMVDPEEREKIIVEQITKLAKDRKGKVLIDKDLLKEVVYLVEYPTALIGNFEDEFLALPKEVVITPMKEHQRYFPVVDQNDKLLPYFITVRNGNEEYLDIVRTGNERVLRARLKDAQFFYNEDLKEKLEKRVDSLKTVVYQEKLGTIYDKVERIAKIVEFLGNKLMLSQQEMTLLKRAAYLCKADLVTGMVNEFDELQGVMGREYALINGEPKEVAEAIFTHYLPRFSGDETPQDMFGKILSISDKLDSVVGSFGIGVQPTGSQDPYGLRRQALGVINIILDHNLAVDVNELIQYSTGLFGNRLTVEKGKLAEDLLAFFKQRIRVILIDDGCRYDIVDAILDTKIDYIGDIKAKVEAVTEQEKSPEFAGLLTALTRVFNLAEKASVDAVDEALFENSYEKTLYSALEKVNKDVEQKLSVKQFNEAIQALNSLTGPINQFFDNTMVMVDNEKVRNNRLALLKGITFTALKICNFTKIV